MFVSINVDSAQEAKVAPAGRYLVQVLRPGETGVTEKEKEYIQVSFGFVDFPDYRAIRQRLWLPQAGDNEGASKFKALMLHRFLVQFNVPHEANGFDLTDFSGLQAEANVVLEENPETHDQFNQVAFDRLPAD